MATSSKYSKIFTGYLSNYSPDYQANFENMLDHLIKECKVKGETVKKHLDEFFLENPKQLEKVKYYIPKSELIVSLTIQRLKENITEVNLNTANNIAGEVFNDFKHPLQKKLVEEHWSPRHDNKIPLTVDEILEFLNTKYEGFHTSIGNRLVSLAGTVNELLVEQALKNIGMLAGDFKRTGGNTKGDFIIHNSTAREENLFVEVKSHNARERLQRALSEIKNPLRVGLGFFKHPEEFTEDHTKRLMDVGKAAAIYMPGETLNQVAKQVKATAAEGIYTNGSMLYRPFEQFATDMKAYNTVGKLPVYNP